jgi:uncharacterized protein (DUF1499 family)
VSLRSLARAAAAAGLLALLLAAAGLAIGGCESARMETDMGLVDGRLRPCPKTPNCVCSEDPAAAVAPLAFEGDPARAFADLVAFLLREPRVELARVEPTYVHAVFRTRLFRFRDDVELRLDPAASVIHVRSASRVGRSDLGANRRRVESLRARWRD